MANAPEQVTCAPGTHFYRADATKRVGCVYCGGQPTPKPPHSRCPHCCGTGISSMTWLGPRGHHWQFDDCEVCDGTGRPRGADA